MSEITLNSERWHPLAKGAKTVKAELKDSNPIMLHVGRKLPTGMGVPYFTLTTTARRATLPNLNKNDTVYGRAKRADRTARVTLLIDRGKYL